MAHEIVLTMRSHPVPTVLVGLGILGVVIGVLALLGA